MAINAEWHRQHPMPRNPTLEQRLAWHLAHREQCGCRPMPEKLQRRVAERETPVRRPDRGT
jgi:hypothetical protein